MTVPWYFTVPAYIIFGFISIKIAALMMGSRFYTNDDDSFCAGSVVMCFLLWPIFFFGFVCAGFVRVIGLLSKLVIGYRPKPPGLTAEERRLLKQEGIDP
jgi:hypothetical protein